MSKAPMRLVQDGKKPKPMKFAFTKKTLEAIKPGDRQKWVYDERAGGLALLVTPAGAMTFYFARRIEGRYRRVKIGHFPELSVEQARKQAAKLGGQIAEGRNPAEERRQARAAMTLNELFAMYLDQYAKAHKRSWEQDERLYEHDIKAKLGTRRIDRISRADIQAWHIKRKDAPVKANRALQFIGRLYSYAASAGVEVANPVKGVQKFRETARERWLDEDELPRFLAAVEAEPSAPHRDYLKLALFTGARRHNLCTMRWDEIDTARAVWTIPVSKAKAKAAIEIPLVPQVMAILEERRGDDPEWVFPARYSEGYGSPHMTEPRFAFLRACERAGISDLTLHDLRRTVASWAMLQGVPYPVVARMVGHKPQGVTAIYARFGMASVRDGFEKTVAAMLSSGKAEAANKQGEG